MITLNHPWQITDRSDLEVAEINGVSIAVMVDSLLEDK